MRRSDLSEIHGYQRPEVVNHIKSIKSYVESDSPILPNAVVIAFDSRVKFIPNSEVELGYSRQGHLSIPLADTTLPGFIVDGQQRIAAIRDAKVESFPILVSSFISQDEHEQRAQFILVNSTKPLPKGLIHELLPSTETLLPPQLQKKRFPAAIVEELNFRESSPLQGMIKTATSPSGIIKDNSIMKMIENSLTDGVLYRFRNPLTGEGDVDSICSVVSNFFAAVKITFLESWGLPPRRSRLLHGVGIISLGYVMDSISEHHSQSSTPDSKVFEEELTKLKPYCAWSSGKWEFDEGSFMSWNELQNVPSDIQLLTSFLLSTYERVARKYQP